MSAIAEQSIPVVEGASSDRQAIRDLIESWVIWRDAGDWEKFASVWHDDGRMVTTWCSVDAAEFVNRCRQSFENGFVSLHTLGGTSLDISGTRAVAQTKMQLLMRGAAHGVPLDVICYGRFVDALEKREGRWGIVLRQPVYELDQVIPHQPGVPVDFDRDLLATFPEGYRHLGYVQTQMGMTVDRKLPGTRGPEIEQLNRRMRRWLDGEPRACLDEEE